MDGLSYSCRLNFVTVLLFIVSIHSFTNQCCSAHTIQNHHDENYKQGTQEVTVRVDVGKTVANLTHFWKSTGFCPPDPHDKAGDWFLSADMYQNLAYIASVPQQGISQVRIHWLLDAVTVSSFSADGTPQYDFSLLDVFIEYLYDLGLHVGFELMGNPSNYFNDMENKTQVYLWRDLVAQVAARYIDQFGLVYVSKWNFESWNEPKPNHFDTLPFTIQGFLNYYDACGAGLWSVHPSLRLGGPGGECSDQFDPYNSYCWALLAHVDHGQNFFTGVIGGRLDFISIHRKGEEPDNTAWIFSKEKNFLTLLNKHLPGLNDLPLYNDEADPLVTWSRPLWWRADATYAAMVTKVIVEHQNKWLSKPGNSINYSLLSNDNGFLSYNPAFFTQRTLVARFQINDTTPPHVQLIRKPALTVMGLLAMQGETQVDARLSGLVGDQLNVLASVHRDDPSTSQDSWQATVLVYYSDDSHNKTNLVTLNLDLEGLWNVSSSKDMLWVAYQMDNGNGNPYRVWQEMGSPVTPSVNQLRVMRQHEDPVRVDYPSSLQLQLSSHSFLLPMPGVLLFHICAKPKSPPGQVRDVMFFSITHNQVLISWSDARIVSKCVWTYEVEFSSASEEGPFSLIHSNDIIFTSFVYVPLNDDSPDCVVYGYYRVRVVDYWGQAGEFSEVTEYRD